MAYTRRFVGAGGGGGAGSGTVTNTGNLTANHLVIGNGGVDESVLASLGTTTTLLHGNAAGAPSFASVNLATEVGSSVVAAANGGVANVTTLGGTFLCADGCLSNNLLAINLTVSGGVANKIEGFAFIHKHIQVVGHLSVRTPTSLGGGSLWSAGVYDSAGNLAYYTGALNGTVTTLQTVTAKDSAGNATSYTMNPGVYYLVVTATVVGAGNTYGFNLAPSSAVINQYINNANANRQVISATNTVNAVLPAAIGVLSASANNIAIVGMFAEP